MEKNLNEVSGSGGATAESLSVPQNSEESVLSSRVEKFDFSFQASDGEIVDASPIYRLVIDLRFGSLLGALQLGYYVRVNDSVYFVSKQTVQVATYEQTEKVFAFLAKTKLPFTISVRHSETLSRFQSVTGDVNHDSTFYSLREYKVFRGLWREIEGVLFENLYSPSLARFTGDKLDWYVKLMPEHSLQFTQVANVQLQQVATQGHLQVFKMPKLYTLPYYLYLPRRRLTFFNHSLEGDMYVVPLGAEQRIVHLEEETTVTSTDHEPIVLDVGEYLLIHPRPRPRHTVD
jgi:hypothetical protein